MIGRGRSCKIDLLHARFEEWSTELPRAESNLQDLIFFFIPSRLACEYSLFQLQPLSKGDAEDEMYYHVY